MTFANNVVVKSHAASGEFRSVTHRVSGASNMALSLVRGFGGDRMDVFWQDENVRTATTAIATRNNRSIKSCCLLEGMLRISFTNNSEDEDESGPRKVHHAAQIASGISMWPCRWQFSSRTVLGRLSRRLIYDHNIRLALEGVGDQILLQKGSL